MTRRTCRVRWLAFFAGSMLLLAGCGGPPAMGPDREVFTTVDALYTAVGIKSVQQLERCDTTLRELHAAGKLPNDAYQSLDRIMARAKNGDWETAADHLRWFMQGQKRK